MAPGRAYALMKEVLDGHVQWVEDQRGKVIVAPFATEVVAPILCSQSGPSAGPTNWRSLLARQTFFRDDLRFDVGVAAAKRHGRPELPRIIGVSQRRQ